ncbi:hypothetical protein ACYKDZ_17715 [Stutzerimonas stutzeri]
MTNFIAGMAVCAVLFQRLDVAAVWFVAAALSLLISDFRGAKARDGK